MFRNILMLVGGYAVVRMIGLVINNIYVGVIANLILATVTFVMGVMILSKRIKENSTMKR